MNGYNTAYVFIERRGGQQCGLNVDVTTGLLVQFAPVASSQSGCAGCAMASASLGCAWSVMSNRLGRFQAVATGGEVCRDKRIRERCQFVDMGARLQKTQCKLRDCGSSGRGCRESFDEYG